MPAKTPNQIALDYVQSRVAPILKVQGFRKSGRSHSRTTSAGLKHLIDFWSGPSWTSLTGSFTVDVGVYFPCVPLLEYGRASKNTREPDCQIRARLSKFAGTNDKWWPLADSLDATVQEILNLIDAHVLPFFDRFEDYSDGIQYYLEFGSLPFKHRERSALEIAMIYSHLGDLERARQSIAEALESSEHKGFSEHVRQVAQRIGVSGF